jgi:methylenetetrahydrofolate reductase (NADPH)
MNSFAQALNSSRLILTAECLPPRGTDSEAVRNLAFPPGLDAIVVADNPGEIRSSAFSAARILKDAGHSGVILSMATRDRNRLALLSDALGAAALNFSAILCMSGQHQSLGVCPQAASANDLDSVQLTRILKQMILDGSEFNGKEVKGVEPKLEFQVGALAHPFMQPMDLNLLRLKKKIVAGADFVITQAVFGFEDFCRWMDEVRAAGFDKRTAIIASVLPLAGVAQAKSLQQSRIYGPIADPVVDRIGSAANEAQEGAAIASEMAVRLKKVPGVRGIHVLSGGRESVAATILQQITK